MLAPALDTIRLSLHVLAATIWVGGQLTLAALVPTLKAAGVDVPKAAARRFSQVAWPAFAVLVATGIWNITAVHDQSDTYKTVVMVKVAVVILSGLTAYLHQRAKTRKGLAVFGALTGLTALSALVIGIVLAG
ncbi:MAG TPA: CopD family protein [Frankiaceae bacterium]|jgi:putative copper export protein|nr:CopD family protein [Frankiaceae bacterium]